METYLQQMMFGLEDEKSKETMKDYIVWKEELHKSYSLSIRDLFKYLKLFIGELPFEYIIEYYKTGDADRVFDFSYISYKDINTYYAIIKPKSRSLKDNVVLKVSYDMLNLYNKHQRDIVINDFIRLYEDNYLRKPNIITEAKYIDENSLPDFWSNDTPNKGYEVNQK